MSETIKLLILIPFTIVFFTILLKHAKKVDKFQARVKKYIEEKHSEIKIIRQLGFGFELQINNKTYPAWLHPPYQRYKKKPNNFENIIENYLFQLPLTVGGREIKK